MQLNDFCLSDPWDAIVSLVNTGKIPSAILLQGGSLTLLQDRAYGLASSIILLDSPESEYKVRHKIHPDIYEYFPSGKGKLHSIDVPREIRRKIWIQPYESNYKVYLIHEADRMTLSAMSAFLKTLEDPPNHGVIIMTSNNSKRLPATIRSRVFAITLQEKDNIEISKQDIEYLFSLISGALTPVQSGQIVKGNSESDKQLLREKAKSLIESLVYLLRDRFILSLNSTELSLYYPDYKHLIMDLPIIPLEKIVMIASHANQALENSSSASGCIEWVTLQVMSLKNQTP
ncbi:DNA polymerase III, delta subunit [Chlamydia ibidis]|uniref:DNA polymerase III, delta subunit n=2 Tax=Chlamydia ibidis TaxID=1405396 RepID=S7J4Z0_9CHLA|nr:DNA polymerase III, delta subunit [Chlamydia ibidis]EPP35117.1 DNA polymerase III, delta subunit [Chlamydia ibidis]EQM62774.1 DNA polymerase III subunit gamma/tau [Chlamydia ibidis 10-1398/6]